MTMNTIRGLLSLIAIITASFVTLTHAQDLPKKYGTLELFTNTPCPSCVAQNPGFFSLLNSYAEDIHIISFYPGTPYSSCPIYQANTVEHRFRGTYRGYNFTPEVNVGGTYSKRSGSITSNDLDAAIGGESFLYIDVTEAGTINRSATIRLQTFEASPTSTGKLFVAVVEKEVMLTGINPNWEANHHNVFRQFLTDKEGMMVDLSLADQSIPFNFNVDVAWDSDEIFVMAWVENPDTKETYNSGTKFDDAFSSTTSTESTTKLEVFPNPAHDFLTIKLPSTFDLKQIEFIDVKGKIALISDSVTSIDISKLQNGVYTIIVKDQEERRLTTQFVKK
jgi:hypothetical protein